MEETSLLITSSDKNEIAKIRALLAANTDSTKTRYVDTDLKAPKNVTTESTQKSGTSADQSIKTQKEVGQKSTGGDVRKVRKIFRGLKLNDAPKPRSLMKRPLEQIKPVSNEVVKEVGVKRPKLMKKSSKMVMTSEDEMETDKWHDKYDWSGRRYLQCQKCGFHVSNCLESVEIHLISHTPLQEFECSVEKCGYKEYSEYSMFSHYDEVHPNVTCVLKQVEQTKKYREKCDAIKKKCFPELNVQKTTRNTCQLCQEVMIKNSDTERRIHSIFHTKIMLYKCNEPGCQYEVNHPGEMKEHEQSEHEKNIPMRDVKIKLTDEQELEIASKMKKCFPE